MKRAVQITAMLAVLVATATSASAYRIEKVEASSPLRGKHYLYSCICDNGSRVIAYSTSPINGNDCLTACYHAGSGYTGSGSVGPQMTPVKPLPVERDADTFR